MTSNSSQSPTGGHVVPTELQRVGNSGVSIIWSDGTTTKWSTGQLRSVCPCALCREKKQSNQEKAVPTMLPVLSAAEAAPLTITGMRPVGNYAYNIAFSDGHSSGVYQFALLYAGP
ncbi:MAG: DUF971 domain-containing protein [Planctomycetota bacterium]